MPVWEGGGVSRVDGEGKIKQPQGVTQWWWWRCETMIGLLLLLASLPNHRCNKSTHSSLASLLCHCVITVMMRGASAVFFVNSFSVFLPTAAEKTFFGTASSTICISARGCSACVSAPRALPCAAAAAAAAAADEDDDEHHAAISRWPSMPQQSRMAVMPLAVLAIPICHSCAEPRLQSLPPIALNLKHLPFIAHAHFIPFLPPHPSPPPQHKCLTPSSFKSARAVLCP